MIYKYNNLDQKKPLNVKAAGKHANVLTSDQSETNKNKPQKICGKKKQFYSFDPL